LDRVHPRQPAAGPGCGPKALEPLTGSAWVKRWLAAVSTLPAPEARTVFRDKETRTYYSPGEAERLPREEREALERLDLPATYYYTTRYGTPLAYARALDLAAADGFEPAPGAKVLDFGCGGIGPLRLLAALGLETVGVDVDSSLRALYRKPEDLGPVHLPGGPAGSVSLVIGRFPADEEARRDVGGGYDLVISKNTLKNGYLHPERPVDKRMLIDLGVSDEQFARTIHSILKPGGRFMIYNLAPAPSPPDQPYKPWSDGRTPFPREMLEAAGFQVVAFDVDDSPAARTMGRALGWDRGDSPMDLEHDLFATWTLVRRR